VRRHARQKDLDSVIDAIERFTQQHRWLKVAGGRKARLLEFCVRPGDRVAEFGTYVGYSALVLTRRLRRLGGGGRVVSCEADAWNAFVARSLLEFAGVDAEVEVCVGHAADWIATGSMSDIDLLILDHRGTAYHKDLEAIEPSLCVGSRVFADNVLYPGAPLFLAYIEDRYHFNVHEVDEYMQPTVRDWVVVCMRRSRPTPTARPAPRELQELSAEIDEVSWRSIRGPVDWVSLRKRVAPILVAWHEAYVKRAGDKAFEDKVFSEERQRSCVQCSGHNASCVATMDEHQRFVGNQKK